MDYTDKKILAILEKNARISMKELAQKVSLTPPAAKERVTKLEEAKIINGYYTAISLDALDRNTTAYILFETNSGQDLYDFAIHHPDVLECHRLAGQFSYLVKISTCSMEDLEQFIDEAIVFGKSSTHMIFSSNMKPIFHNEVSSPV